MPLISRVSLMLALLLGAAYAQPMTRPAGLDQADWLAQLSQRANAAFEAKRFEEAANLYREAYRIEPVATLLFNIAFIYDAHLKERGLARDYYRRYVNAPDAERTAQIRAYERLSAFEAEDKAAAAVPPAAPVAVPTAAPVAVPTAAPVAVPTAAPVAVPTAAPSSAAKPVAVTRVKTDPEGSGTTVPVILISVGGASLLTGSIVSILAAQTHSDYAAARTEPERGDLSKTGKTQALVADITLGVGLAALTTGLILMLSDDDSTAAMGPTTVGDAPGLFYGLRF